MTTVERSIDSSQDAIFDALTTPETYPHWLVGAQDIRTVEDGWPSPGTAFHHRVGLAGPVTVADFSRVIDIEAPHHLSLDVRARPFGRAQATFDLIPSSGNGSARCTVRLHEVPVGAAAVLAPVVHPLLVWRNRRSLARLDDYLHGER